MKVFLKIGCAATVLILIAACSREQKKIQATEKIIAVKVQEIAVTQPADTRHYVGTVEEAAAVSLSFSALGTVQEVFVQEGQRVQKGQLLATLNRATAENASEGALAKLRQAQDAFDRLTKLHDNGSLPDIKMVEVETGLQQAKSMAAIAKKNVDDCYLYSPRNGVIATRSIETGESVNPLTAAFKLVSIDRVFVKIPVPENEIGTITPGKTATVVVAALNKAVFTGKIEMKGVTAHVLSHTYEAKIGISNPQLLLMPGMVCKVTLADANGGAEIVVPNRVVQISAEGEKYVWLAKGKLAKRCFVETGKLTDYGITVTKGLTAGDSLIVEGIQNISEGTKITVSMYVSPHTY